LSVVGSSPHNLICHATGLEGRLAFLALEHRDLAAQLLNSFRLRLALLCQRRA
jgi:hypothetical protein